MVSEQRNKTIAEQDVGEALFKTGRTGVESGPARASELTILGRPCCNWIKSGKFSRRISIRTRPFADDSNQTAGSLKCFSGSCSSCEMNFVGGLPQRVNKCADGSPNRIWINAGLPTRAIFDGLKKSPTASPRRDSGRLDHRRVAPDASEWTRSD